MIHGAPWGAFLKNQHGTSTKKKSTWNFNQDARAYVIPVLRLRVQQRQIQFNSIPSDVYLSDKPE